MFKISKDDDFYCCDDFGGSDQLYWVDSDCGVGGDYYEGKGFSGWSVGYLYMGYPGAEHIMYRKQIFFCPFCGAKLR